MEIKQIGPRSRCYEYALKPVAVAQDIVATERREVDAERQAFEDFSDCIAAIDASRPVQPPMESPLVVHEFSNEKTVAVRRAYRETVMDVSHYERAYGDSFKTNVTVEFDADIAEALTSDIPFTPTLKGRLLRATSQVLDKREKFLEILAEESIALATAETDLSTIATSLSDCVAPRTDTVDTERFGGGHKRLRTVIERRQETVQTRIPHSRVDKHDLYTYLFANEPWTYPVLHAVATLQQELDALKSRGGDDSV